MAWEFRDYAADVRQEETSARAAHALKFSLL